MSQKGISLVQLIIVIILLLILASLSILLSDDVTVEARIAREYESIKSVKTAVDEAINLIDMNPEIYKENEMFGQRLGEKKEEYYQKIGLTSPDELSDRVYLINEDNQEKLSIENMTEEKSYIVDLDNKKYYVIDGVRRTSKDEKVYEYVDIVKLYNLVVQ